MDNGQIHKYSILPISHQYMTHVSSQSRPYFSHLNLGKNIKIKTPPHLKLVLILDYEIFMFATAPLLWTFSTFSGHFAFGRLSLFAGIIQQLMTYLP